MNCYLGCPMLNQFGVCESALRKPEHIRECPHTRMKRQLREQDEKSVVGEQVLANVSRFDT